MSRVNIAARFREYARLERLRSGVGLSPDELKRWAALKRSLNKAFSPGLSENELDQRQSLRVSTFLRLEVESSGDVRDGLMTVLSRGGLFVATEAVAEVGTRVVLRLRVRERAEAVEVPAEVVSNPAAPDSSHPSGMGVRFLELSPEAQAVVDQLYEDALDRAAARAEESEAAVG